MKKHLYTLLVLLTIVPLVACSQQPTAPNPKQPTVGVEKTVPGNPYYSRTSTEHLNVSNAEWKRILPIGVYNVAREAATEQAFTGEYWNTESLGEYYCFVCGNHLFRSDAKFASSCGWPSFYEPINKNSVVYKADNAYGMIRTEVLCGRCDSHLGHIFDDGPPPTYKRFCMNSAVLEFEPDSAESKN